MGEVALGFNNGKVFMHLARHTYTTLTQVIIECVQNALDANARNVWIKVDMRKRTIIVANDGDGVDVELFERALMSVGEGVKDKTKLGRFGLGLISPLDKCRYYTFTSRPNGDRKWLRWRFEAAQIEPQSNEVRIPLSRIGDERMKGDRYAVSLLSIHGFTKDRATSALDPGILANSIQEKLGPAMRKLGVTCHLEFHTAERQTVHEEIKPLDYAGEALPPFTYEDTYVGKVEFELYRAVRTSRGRNGLVVLSELDSTYPITWKEFTGQTRDVGMTGDLIKALGSGFFEGVVRAEKVELHPSRNKFVRNDAVFGLVFALEEWFADIGRAIYEDERIEQAERRYQELGLRTLDRLDDLLHQPEFSHLREALKALEKGTIGQGHVPPKGKVTKEETDPSKRVGPGGVNVRKEPDGGRESKAPQDPERPGDVPLSAAGPDGRRRRITRRNSGGLQFSYGMPEGSERLWELDPLQGIVYFNVRHPTWLKIADKDHHVLHLQEWIAIQALGMLLQPETAFPLLPEYVDSQTLAYVELMVIGGHRRTRTA